MLQRLALLVAVLAVLPQPAWAATFTVTSTSDAVDAAPGNGICATAAGVCTLRAAIQEANALAGGDRIVLPAGTYRLTLAGTSEEAGATGDLDINVLADGGTLAIDGANAGTTIIDANGVDRAFDIRGDVTLTAVTIRGGRAVDVGGIAAGPGALAIRDSTLTDNAATSVTSVGAITKSSGTLEVTRSSVAGNTGGCVGGIFTIFVSLAISNATIVGNSATAACATPTGGVSEGGGSVTINNTTLASNTPTNFASINDAALTVSNSLFVSTGGTNCSFTDTAAVFNAGGNFASGTACAEIPATAAAGLLEPLSTAANGTSVRRPLTGNPAIGGGVNATCAATDQRSGARPQAAVCDSGAVEIVPAAVTSGAPPSASRNAAYVHTLTAAGEGPFTYAITAGALPAGLSLSAAGVISGTPASGGSSSFTVTATDAVGQTATQAGTIVVVGLAPRLLPATLPLAHRGMAYLFRFQAEAIDPRFSLVSGSLPRGLQLGADGSLSGTPTESGPFVFGVQVRAVFGEATAVYTLVVNGPPLIEGLASVSIEENRPVPPVTIRVSDDLTNADAISVSVAASDASILRALSVTGSGALRTLNLTLAEDREGTVTIALSASDGVLSSIATAVLTVTPAPIPDPPTDLAAAFDGTAVVFSWRAPAGGAVATFYALEGGNASGRVTLPVINTGRVTTYRTEVAAGTWFFRVRSGNSAGTSAPSTEISGTMPPTIGLPGAPRGLSAAVNASQVSLAWQPPAEGDPADTWDIEVGSAAGASDRGVFAVGAGALAVSGTLGDGEYFARVRGRNAAGVGPASNEVQFTVGGATPCGSGAPDPPVLLSATVVNSAVTLTWRPPTNADVQGYRILVGSEPRLADIAAFEVGAVTSFVATAPKGRYHLALVAMNACGTSQLSNTIVVEVQ